MYFEPLHIYIYNCILILIFFTPLVVNLKQFLKALTELISPLYNHGKDGMFLSDLLWNFWVRQRWTEEGSEVLLFDQKAAWRGMYIQPALKFSWLESWITEDNVWHAYNFSRIVAQGQTFKKFTEA